MSIPDASHPIWAIARQLILVVTLGLFCTFNFENGFDWASDPRFMLGMAIVGGTSEVLPRLFKKAGSNGS